MVVSSRLSITKIHDETIRDFPFLIELCFLEKELARREQ